MLFLLVSVLMASGGCAPRKLSRYSYAQIHMGVQARVVLFAEDEAAARAAAGAAFQRIAELDSVLSDYRQDSELNRLCGRPAGVWTPVSEDLFRTLRVARGISEATGGAFDATVGPLTRLWREARRESALPDADALGEARRRVGWRLVELDPSTRSARLLRSGMRLDMGGIGKGLAAAEAVATLRAHGVERSLVSLAGDIAAGEPPPGETWWEVRIETGDGGLASPKVRLRNASVSTSGDTEQYVEIGGVRYSHILDPRTGRALTSRTAATAVAPDGALADAFASAACVLGPDAAAQPGAALGVSAVRIVSDGEERRLGPRARIVFADHDAPRSTR